MALVIVIEKDELFLVDFKYNMTIKCHYHYVRVLKCNNLVTWQKKIKEKKDWGLSESMK